MNATTTTSLEEAISTLPEAAKRELAVWLLGHFDSDTILELLREVRPAEQVYDYEDPGPITDEEIAFCALQAALRMDQEEAAHEQSATR
jgi:hypothetical protein